MFHLPPAAHLLSMVPRDCVVIEDAPTGVRAAGAQRVVESLDRLDVAGLLR